MKYTCDTEGGSSGSPVLSRTNNKIIALHHCGGGCNGNLGAPIYQFYSDIAPFLPGSPTASPTSSPTSSPTTAGTPCSDVKSDKFFFKKKKGRVLIKKCKWLMKKSADKIDQVCRKRTDSHGAYGPAKDVCKATCGTC